MSDKLTAEEIAKQIREEVATGKYGFIKAVSRALKKHARQEVEEATKPLVEALEEGEHTYRWDGGQHDPKCEYCRLRKKALTAHYAKYPKEQS